MAHGGTIRISRDNLRDHCAFLAWTCIAPDAREPSCVATLKERRKTSVYRLDGAGPGGSAVIAKRCRRGTGEVERAVYERVLPRLPVTSLQYYGCVEQGEMLWLFLESVAGDRFTIALEEHRLLASRWLALTHSWSEGLATVDELPDRGAVYHFALLQSTREALRRSLFNPLLGATDRSLLQALMAQCDDLEALWARVADVCATVPPTLVHGDFRAKNARVRMTASGRELAVLDWETAGRGAPATDLASTRALELDLIDIDTYCAVARRRWPALDARIVRRLTAVGRIFRRLTAVAWAASGLQTLWPQRSLSRVRVYQQELSDDLRALSAPGIS